MGAEDQPARAGPPPGKAADHVAHRVEPRAHARLAHPPHDELRRLGVLRGQVTARELGGVLAAFSEIVEPLHGCGSDIHTFSRHAVATIAWAAASIGTHRPIRVPAGGQRDPCHIQLMERLTRIGGYTEHRELELDRERLLTEGLASFPTTAMLGHGGFSFFR